MRKTIVVFLALVGAIALGWALSASNPGVKQSDPVAVAPTPDDVISRFEEIDSMRIAALEDRDLGLVVNALTSNSPMLQRIRGTIRRLVRDKVIVQELSTLESVALIRQTPSEARLEVVVFDDRRFVSENGAPVDFQGSRERQVAECLMQRVDTTWKLHDCTIIEAQSQ